MPHKTAKTRAEFQRKWSAKNRQDYISSQGENARIAGTMTDLQSFTWIISKEKIRLVIESGVGAKLEETWNCGNVNCFASLVTLKNQ